MSTQNEPRPGELRQTRPHTLKIKQRAVPILLALSVYLSVEYWVMTPYHTMLTGLVSGGLTEAQAEAELVRSTFPIHLVSPVWLHDPYDWPRAESRARLAVVCFAVVAATMAYAVAGENGRSK